MVVLHSTKSCSYCMQIGSFSCNSKGFPMVISTQLESKDFIFGSASKLERTIIQSFQKFQPKAIVVLNTCSTQLNNDDVKGALKRAEVKISCGLSYCDTGCNIAFGMSKGNDLAWQALVKQFKTGKEKSKAVGIIGRSGMDTDSLAAIEMVFDKAGVDFISFPAKTFQQMENISSLENAFILSPVAFSTARTFQDQLDIKCHYSEIPAGIGATSRFFLRAADVIRCPELINIARQEEKRVLAKVKLLKIKMHKRKPNVLCLYGPGNEFSIAKILSEFGANVFFISNLKNEYAEKEMFNLTQNYKVNVLDEQPEEIEQVIKENKINAVFTEIQFNRKGYLGVPIFYSMFYSGEYGYDYAVDFVENFLSVLENKTYSYWQKLQLRYVKA